MLQVISAERMGPYHYGGATLAAAMARYSANVAVCEAFYPVLHVLEIALRNRLFDVITRELPKRYPGVKAAGTSAAGTTIIATWLDPQWLDQTWPVGLPPLFPKNAVRDIDDAKGRILGRDPDTKALTPMPHSRPVTAGKLVATMDFGFWVGLFHASFVFRSAKDPRLWGKAAGSPDLLALVFPHAPAKYQSVNALKVVRDRLHRLRKFRNRVFHHEPVATPLRRDPLLMYQTAVETIAWIEPEAARAVEGLGRLRAVASAQGERAVHAATHRVLRRR
ncbi:MAG: hypothetical protein ACK52I_10010 [Pseudomonadota bacterium]